ncbi:hypothetical protein YB2330_002473 [Saitoella coloradoensis]
MPFTCILSAFGVKLHLGINKKDKSLRSRESFLLPDPDTSKSVDSVASSTLTEDIKEKVEVVSEEVNEVRLSGETLCSEVTSSSPSTLRVSWAESTKPPHHIKRHERRHKRKSSVVTSSPTPDAISEPWWDHFARRNTARAFQKSVAGLLIRKENPLQRVDYTDGRRLSNIHIRKYVGHMSRWGSWMEPPRLVYRSKVRC